MLEQLEEVKIPCFTCQKEFPITEMKKDLFVYLCPDCYQYLQDTGLMGLYLKRTEEGDKWIPINQR